LHQNFEQSAQEAKIACKNARETIEHRFADLRKTIATPKGVIKEIDG
jgi:hypothetical protein